MAARLSELVGRVTGSYLLGKADPALADVTADSRQVPSESLFVAVKGFAADGNQFVPAALDSGAAAVASENLTLLERLPPQIGRWYVPDSRLALALASDFVYGHPSGDLKLIGVTGTNGKTTGVTLAAAVLEAAGLPSATLGTLGLSVRGEVTPGDRTTPEAPAIQRTLRELVNRGIRAVAMEVSSHALSLQRTAGLAFDSAVFTNLTQDHLDYHPTMEDYYQAKRQLFLDYPSDDKPFTAVINIDDEYGARLASEVKTPVIQFGLGSEAALRAENPVVTPSSVSFTARYAGVSFPVEAPLGAHFNVYNALGAVGVGLALGFSPEIISRGLSAARPVDGRFESVPCGQPFTVIVDYAHTPDGLLNVLRSARQIAGRNLIAVFGCGGDRDPTKRPKMGAIAAEWADQLVVTSDNPRTEKPASIIEQILAGIDDGARSKTLAEVDRREAIRLALEMAGDGDVVVIAGKGHETYQIFADRTIHFDDREVVREILGNGGPL